VPRTSFKNAFVSLTERGPALSRFETTFLGRRRRQRVAIDRRADPNEIDQEVGRPGGSVEEREVMRARVDQSGGAPRTKGIISGASRSS
jgi:hypothetical protein